MEKIFFTPGPTELHPEVNKFINEALSNKICSINHRSSDFMNIYKSASDNLKKLLNIPESYSIFFLSSATECMDRIIQNTVESKSFHFVNGAFAERFYKTSIELNKHAEKADAEFGESFDFDNTNITNNPELICITQNETSTGVAVSPYDIIKIKEKFPDSLIAVDIVSSVPIVNLFYEKIDSAFFSVQKGFGLPAGLGVLIVNQKCLEKAGRLKSAKVSIGSYHNFISLHENAIKNQTSETPNVLGIYLLGKICESLLNIGLEKVRIETKEKSKLLYDFFDNHKSFNPFVKNKSNRSDTIININTAGKNDIIRKKLSDNGLIVGSGYGKFKDSQIRIANFPMHRKSDVEKILKIIEEQQS